MQHLKLPTQYINLHSLRRYVQKNEPDTLTVRHGAEEWHCTQKSSEKKRRKGISAVKAHTTQRGQHFNIQYLYKISERKTNTIHVQWVA